MEKREATDDKFLSRQYLSFPTLATRNVKEQLNMSTTPIRLMVGPSNMAAIGSRCFIHLVSDQWIQHGCSCCKSCNINIINIK
jgi:hypothetical protein